MSVANSLLDNGRAIAARNGGPGMSARSRGLLESFYGNGPAIFNQLYVRAENQEVANITTIMALRSKHKSLVSETITETAKSSTSGTNVDKEV